MTSETNRPLDDGERFSSALDPHRRRSLIQAFETTVRQSNTPLEQLSVALIGWESATLVGEVYDDVGRVVIIEDAPHRIESIQEGLAARDLGKKVELIEADPAEVSLDNRVDIAVSSVTSTWLMEGEEAEVLRNVQREVLTDDGAMIPRRFVHLFELASPPTRVGGLTLKAPRLSRPGEPVPTLSESKQFKTSTLQPSAEGPAVPPKVDDTIIVRPLLDGRLTALKLTTMCELADGVLQVTSEAGLQSILVPLRDPIDVEAGEPVSIHLTYEPGRGLKNARFTARVMPDDEASPTDWAQYGFADEFQQGIAQMIEQAERRGRADDLKRVVQHTIEPHGDVSRLTAFFWMIDEEYRKSARDIVETFRREASSEVGEMPGDETIYELMLEVYRDKTGQLRSGEAQE
jgi:hypothetical protein